MNKAWAILGRDLGLVVLLLTMAPSARALNSSGDYLRLGGSRALTVDSHLSSRSMEIGYSEALSLLTRFFQGKLSSPSDELSDAQIVLRSALSNGIFSSRFSNATLREGIRRVLKVDELKKSFLDLQKYKRGSVLAGIEGRSLDSFLFYFRMWIHVHQYGFESESAELANEARYFLVTINSLLEDAKVGTVEQKKTYLDQLIVFSVLSVIPAEGTDANAELFEKMKASAIEFVRGLENPAVMGPILVEADRRESGRSKAAMKWGALLGAGGYTLVRLALSYIYPWHAGLLYSSGGPFWSQTGVTAGCAAVGALAGALAHRFFGTTIICDNLDRFKNADEACVTALSTIQGQSSLDLELGQKP